jgi:hypothetical protein
MSAGPGRRHDSGGRDSGPLFFCQAARLDGKVLALNMKMFDRSVIVRIALGAGASSLLLLNASAATAQTSRMVEALRAPEYFRLQLKHNQKYLDAKQCTDDVGMNPGSEVEGGACQLWRLVPAGDGWSRLQLKHGQKFLDAKFCSDKLGLNAGSDFEGGACQLWRLVDAGGGWSRLQLKHGGKYLDASFCRDEVGLNPGSSFDGGACQLWRLVPERGTTLTQTIDPSSRPLATATGMTQRPPRVVVSGGGLPSTSVSDSSGGQAKRGFDDDGRPYVD